MRRSSCLLLAVLGLLPVSSAAGQDPTFENLEFEYLHNADLVKSDLGEKVLLIHCWGTT